jgi:prevent-host-death family protein
MRHLFAKSDARKLDLLKEAHYRRRVLAVPNVARPDAITSCDQTIKRPQSVHLKSRNIAMRYSSQVKPISYLKANAAEVLAQLAAQRQPLVITQNGEAKAVLQDVASFEQTQETLALLKILALGNQDVAAGKVKPAFDVVTRLRAKRVTV